MSARGRRRPGTRTVLAGGLVLALLLAVAVSPYASSSPDGLEKVAAQKSFLERGTTGSVQERAPIGGYAFPGVGDAKLATAAAGLTGTLAMFGLGFVYVRLRPRRAA